MSDLEGKHLRAPWYHKLASCGPRRPLCGLSMVVAVFLFYTAVVTLVFNVTCNVDGQPIRAAVASVDEDNERIVAIQEKTIELLRKQLQFQTDSLAKVQKSTTLRSSAAMEPDDFQKVFLATQRVEELPSSSMWCQGAHPADRICKFRNMCYYPQRDKFIFTRGKKSTIVVDRALDEDRLLDLTSLDGHSSFRFDYEDAASNFFRGKSVSFVPGKTFGFSRFHPWNIMHVIHDDLIGLYFLLKEFADLAPESQKNGIPSDNIPFSLNHNVILLDGHDLGPFGNLINLFTNNLVLTKRSMSSTEVICFDEIIFGQSKQANWYQYGFGTQQGPIVNKTVSGHDVRQVSDFLMKRIGIEPKQPTDQEVITLFSRDRNRKIINQPELVQALESRYKLPVKIVSMETNNFDEQVLILSRSALAIGLHGSILIMGMFLPPGAALVELYPFAVPSENYTPYRTMANLDGMALGYRAWENTHENNSVAFPDRDRLGGGIAHLSPEDQQKIKDTKTVPPHFCCEDAHWLYRIYQDTWVTTHEILRLADGAMEEARLKRLRNEEANMLRAPKIEGVRCESITATSVTLVWLPPWNGASIKRYSVWSHQLFTEYFTTETELVINNLESNSVYDFWVRADHQIAADPLSPRGEYSEKRSCKTVM